MNPAPIKRLISTSDPDKIDVRVGTILAIEGVAHSEKARTAAGWPLSGPEEDVEAICVVPCPRPRREGRRTPQFKPQTVGNVGQMHQV